VRGFFLARVKGCGWMSDPHASPLGGARGVLAGDTWPGLQHNHGMAMAQRKTRRGLRLAGSCKEAG